MNNNRRCPNCGAPNDGFFEYCYKCGTPLNLRSPYGQHYAPYNGSGQYEPATIAGQPIEDVKSFVGQTEGGIKLTRKLIDIEVSRSHTHWCWPVFLFSLLGPMFTAIWFFYRKMYKTGVLVALAGLMLFGADTLINFEYNLALAQEMENLLGSSESFYEFMQKLSTDATTLPSQSSLGTLLTSLVELGSLALGVGMAMFATGIYRSHIGKTLMANPQLSGNFFALTAKGGTSMAAAGIAAAALWIIFNLMQNIPYIAAMII